VNVMESAIIIGRNSFIVVIIFNILLSLYNIE